MAPARSSWWGRIPYLVGASALAALLLWVAVSYLTPRQPGPASPQIAQQPTKGRQGAIGGGSQSSGRRRNPIIISTCPVTTARGRLRKKIWGTTWTQP